MIKFTKKPNINNLLRQHGGNKTAVLNEIRHKYTDYNRVQHSVYASENAPQIFAKFFASVGIQYPELAPVALLQYRQHINRLGK